MRGIFWYSIIVLRICRVSQTQPQTHSLFAWSRRGNSPPSGSRQQTGGESGTGRRSERGEGGEGDGWCYRTEGNSVSFKSVWERQRGQCVWPGLLSSFSPSLSLSQKLLLIKPVCFGQRTAALSSNTLGRTCTRRCTRITDTHAFPCLFVLAEFRCHLLEPLNASNQPNTPACLHLPKRGHTHPTSVNMTYQAECVGLKHNWTLTITSGILYNKSPSVSPPESRDSLYLLLETTNNTLIHNVQCLFLQQKQKRPYWCSSLVSYSLFPLD